MKTKYTPELQSILDQLIKEHDSLIDEIETLETEINAAHDRLKECKGRFKIVKNDLIQLEKANEVLQQYI
jgi:predicted nuclease with TOPRIM domain